MRGAIASPIIDIRPPTTLVCNACRTLKVRCAVSVLLTMALLLAEVSWPYLSTMHSDQTRVICILHSAQIQSARNLARYSIH